MNKIKTQKGITLIALIITIIVLLILAVVAIREISGEGIIAHAIEARNNYKEEQEKEEIKLALNEWKLAGIINPETTFLDFMQEKFGEDNVTSNGGNSVIVTMESGNQYIVSENGTITKLGEGNQLNEYGFYYGVPYIMEATESAGEGAFVFYPSGAVEMFSDIGTGDLVNETGLMKMFGVNLHADYEEGKIKLIMSDNEGSDEVILSVYENGQEISDNIVDDEGNTMTARCDLTKIPHGVYVGETYEGEVDSEKFSMVVNSDGLVSGTFGEQNLDLTWTYLNEWNLWDLDSDEKNPNCIMLSLDGTKAFVKNDDIQVILELKRDQEIEFSDNLIPEGGVYTIKSNGMVLTGDGKTVYFPKTVAQGDKFIYGDYEYRYNDGKLMFLYVDCGWATEYEAEHEGSVDLSVFENLDGWGVNVLDKTKSEYSDMLSTVNGKNVKHLDGVFSGCSNMKKPPKISTNAETINAIFVDCIALDNISEFDVPTGVTSMSFVFYKCSSLNDASVLRIPSNITNLNGTFGHCYSLTKFPDLSGCTASSIRMDGTFSHCTSLTKLEGLTIPSGVTALGGDLLVDGCFQGCTNLTDASSITIPNGCTNISKIFINCTSLTKGPTIPGTITECTTSFDNTPLLTEIQFNGTKEQWNNLNLNSSNNITGKTIHCTDGDIVY